MREHPLLMKGPLVRATLEGRKTQTRRPIKPQPDDDIPDVEYSWAARCPMGQAGDRLWVRETFRVDHNLSRDGHPQVVYLAGGFSVARTAPAGTRGYPDPQDKWTPSIHMPRWACRLVLPLVSVRVERVQDITEEDAKAEGVEPVLMRGIGSYPEWMRPTMREVGGHQKAFELLWKQIYGDALWDANPWVWVAEWKEIEVSK